MKKALLISVFVLITSVLAAQRKTTTSAIVAFNASTSLDNLPKAENKTVIAAIDTKTGSVQFEANVRNFSFANPTMQQHFNGNRWLDSDNFPTFTFKGNIVNPAAVDFTKDGSYSVNVEGILTIKGKEQKINTPATIIVTGNGFSASSGFSVKLADYGITGVSIDAGKVSKEPKITVSAEFK